MFCKCYVTMQSVMKVLKVFEVEGIQGHAATIKEYVLRHVLSVEGVQTHGEGKRTGGDCTPTEICPLREHPTGTIMSAGQLEQFKVEMSVFQIIHGSISVHG